jgi:phosphatidylglycerophosphatase A
VKNNAVRNKTAMMNKSAKRTRWAWIAGTWFGTGQIKPGPGTWGSITATLLWLLVAHLWSSSQFDFSYRLNATTDASVPRFITLGIFTLVAAAAVLIIGIPAATIVARESGTSDPQHVVIDEVCGQWIALLFMPPTWQSALLCLLLFRLFDIVKPPPARQLERLHGGAGVMLDDVAAGVYALVVAHLIQHWFRVAGNA